MRYDAHIHMVLDGVWWRDAIDRHAQKPQEDYIRAVLADYRSRGITYLRDGGDRWGVCTLAAKLSEQYGIAYRTPAFPIYKNGRYGSFIGRGFDDLREYGRLVERAADEGADFIKIMISGLQDYAKLGTVTSEPLSRDEITEMIRIAHEAGLSVMAHANGAQTVRYAAEAGIDSIEHGAYADEAALAAMAEHQTLWTPTVVTVGNIIGCGRYDDAVLRALFASFSDNLRKAEKLGIPICIGSDAGAYLVPHGRGAQDEERYLSSILEGKEALIKGKTLLLQRFG